MKSKRHPIINPDLCTGCGLCFEACCNGVYELVSGKAQVTRPDDCCGSGHDLCAEKCPAGAISFEGEPVEGECCTCSCGSVSGCCGK